MSSLAECCGNCWPARGSQGAVRSQGAGGSQGAATPGMLTRAGLAASTETRSNVRSELNAGSMDPDRAYDFIMLQIWKILAFWESCASLWCLSLVKLLM